MWCSHTAGTSGSDVLWVNVLIPLKQKGALFLVVHVIMISFCTCNQVTDQLQCSTVKIRGEEKKEGGGQKERGEERERKEGGKEGGRREGREGGGVS